MTPRHDPLNTTPSRNPTLCAVDRTNDSLQVAAVLAMAQAYRATLRRSEAPEQAQLADERFDSAIALYEAGRWADAYTALAGLADEGDASAAVLALLMLRYGARLYRCAFAGEPGRIARWAKLGLQSQKAADRRAADGGLLSPTTVPMPLAVVA